MFWFGWPTSEVPELYLTASVLDALRRGRRGDFAGPKGKAALALTAASWAILAVIRYRGVTTPGPVLEAGLREQLGPDYAEELTALPDGADAQRTAQPADALLHVTPAATSKRRTSCPTARTGVPTWPTSGAGATCRATARRRCWCRCPAARG